MYHYEGIAVHKQLNESYRYQIDVPFEVVSRYLWEGHHRVVSKSGGLKPGFIAVHEPDSICVLPASSTVEAIPAEDPFFDGGDLFTQVALGINSKVA